MASPNTCTHLNQITLLRLKYQVIENHQGIIWITIFDHSANSLPTNNSPSSRSITLSVVLLCISAPQALKSETQLEWLFATPACLGSPHPLNLKSWPPSQPAAAAHFTAQETEALARLGPWESPLSLLAADNACLLAPQVCRDLLKPVSVYQHV